MNDRGFNEVRRIRRLRRIVALWLLLGPAAYAVLVGQAFSASKVESADPWLAQYSMVWISLFLAWGLCGYLFQRMIADRKPD